MLGDIIAILFVGSRILRKNSSEQLKEYEPNFLKQQNAEERFQRKYFIYKKKHPQKVPLPHTWPLYLCLFIFVLLCWISYQQPIFLYLTIFPMIFCVWVFFKCQGTIDNWQKEVDWIKNNKVTSDKEKQILLDNLQKQAFRINRHY